MPRQTFVIVGGGLAGAKAAETLREEGFDGRVVLVGAEPESPYERPPLSKEYLRGEAGARPYVHAEGFYAERDIELRTGTRVQRIDPAAHTVSVTGGESLRFDRLLLATGAEPRRLRLPGGGLDGVLYLRTVRDSEAIARRSAAGGKMVSIGAGWIGAEVAASARERGCEVTILEAGQVPLERVLGARLGAVYRDIHVEHGVRFVAGARVDAIEGQGAVTAVRLADGQRIDADFVVVGVGATPRVELGEDAGLAIEDGGIAVDQHLAADAPDVYAAGDVAAAWHPFFDTRVRVEHWANALHQGPTAARNMLDRPTTYGRIPYFFSDQYDVGMEYAGYAPDWDEVLTRGDPASREFVAFWLQDGRVLAGMNVNVSDVNDDIQALIRSQRPVDRIRLSDPAIALSELLPAEVSG